MLDYNINICCIVILYDMYDDSSDCIIGNHHIIKKKVTFKKVVNVILIPNIKDYIDHNIFNDIWYNNMDYHLFFQEHINMVIS